MNIKGKGSIKEILHEAFEKERDGIFESFITECKRGDGTLNLQVCSGCGDIYIDHVSNDAPRKYKECLDCIFT